MSSNRIVTIVGLVAMLCFATGAFAIETTVNGYFSFEWEKQVDKPAEGDGDPFGSFDADMIDLVFNFQISDRVRAATDLTWEHGAATEDFNGNAAIEYAFAEYMFNDALKVRFGKQFVPFGYFNEIHTAKPAFLSVKEASSTNKPKRMMSKAKRFYPRWGSGILFTGDTYVGTRALDYHLLISNGEQEEIEIDDPADVGDLFDDNPYDKDVNNNKAVTARVRLQAMESDDYGSLQVGASYYQDKTNEDIYTKVRSFGGQAEYLYGSFRVMSEFVTGTRENAEDPKLEQTGYWFQPSYAFDNGITPYVRYEEFVRDKGEGDGDEKAKTLVFGVNIEVSGGLIFKVENNYIKVTDREEEEFPGNDYNEIKAAVALGW